jgi:hypothetical protein
MNDMEILKCRHGKPYSENCMACGEEHRRLENLNAERQCTNDAAVAKAKSLGRSHTFIDTDGCEVTATPSGHVFYNMADWY